MDNKELDKQVKQALEGFEVKFKPDSWDFLEQKLNAKADLFEEKDNATPNNDEATEIETETKQYFEKFEAPYNPEHWWILANKLDEIDARNKTLFRMKMMEVAVLLLLLWTVVNYWSFQAQSNDFAPSTQEIVEKPTIIVPKQQQNRNIQNDIVEKSFVQVNKNIKNNPLENTKPTEKTNVAAENINNSADLISNNYISNKANSINQATTFKATNQAESIATANVIAEKTAELDLLPTIALNSVSSRPEFRELTVLPINTPSFVLREKTENGLTFLNPFAKNIQKNWRLGMNMQGDVFGVSGTVKNEAGSLDYSSVGTGYGTGLSISRSVGRLEVESGLNYNSKDYVPASSLEIFDGSVEQGYLADGLKNIQINTVNIPLNAKYQLNKDGKWKISGVLGLSSNFILSANYDRVQVFGKNLQDIVNNFKIKKGTTTNGGGVVGASGGQIPLTQADIEAIKARKDKFYKTLSNGLLEGGNVKDNLYFTANAGFNVEYKINNRWSIGTQTIYQQFINNSIKIGPNQDKYNTISFNLAAKVNL